MTRVLLDEGVPKPLARALGSLGVDATAFPNHWKQLSNGELLARIEGDGFDTLVTGDKNMPFQQQLAGRRIAVLVLPTTRLKDCLALAAEIASAIPVIEMRQFTALGLDGRLSVISSESRTSKR